MKIEEYEEMLYDIDCVSEKIVEEDETHRIVCDPYRAIIPELGISCRYATYLAKFEDSEDFEPDFNLTLIYDKEEEDPAKYLYFENDGLAVSIHNYVTYSGMQEREYNTFLRIDSDLLEDEKYEISAVYERKVA